MSPAPLGVWDVFLRMLCSMAVGMVIGTEREYSNRPAGMRTHILVALGACAVMLTGQMVFTQYYGYGAAPDPARLAAQVITGVGFLGAGTIMREGPTVRGLTTAASLWAVACLGIAAGGGYYAIALMNKGLWTSSGHFVVLWWQDGKVRINDPASTKDARVNGDIQTFRSQAKYYWLVDARAYNKEEDEVTQEQFDKMMDNWLSRKAEEPAADWSKEHREWAEQNGLIAGDTNGRKMYRSFTTREQMMVFLHRFAERFGLV